jgi:hypothetical protein
MYRVDLPCEGSGLLIYVTLNLRNLYNKKCENPRGKVYGLMALVKPSSKVELDYGESVQQVYLDTIMLLMREYL